MKIQGIEIDDSVCEYSERDEVEDATIRCRLKGCNGVLKHYDGSLGYEAMVCTDCHAHYTLDGGIYPQEEKENGRSKI